MNYSKDEIYALECYTSRKADKYLDYEVVNCFLKYLCNPNDLFFGCKDWFYINSEKIEYILNGIEKLYSLCCKYSKTHKVNQEIYRQEHHYDDILEHMDMSSIWIAESFLSFTKGNNYDRFIFGNSTLLKALFNSNYSIPFVDVVDVLGEDEDIYDEQEILLPPFIQVRINKGEYNIEILDSRDCVSFDEVLYNKQLDEFIKLYENGDEFADTLRKEVGYNFSKKLLKMKNNIMF